MISRTMTAVVHQEDELYVAECPEVGTVSQGKTVEEAVASQQASRRKPDLIPLERFG